METAEYISNYENRVTIFPPLVERPAGLHTRRSVSREYLGIIDEWAGETDYEDAFEFYYGDEKLQLFYKLATNLLIIYQLGNTNYKQCIDDIKGNVRLQEYFKKGRDYYSQLSNKKNSNNNKFSKKILLEAQIDKIINLYNTLSVFPTIYTHYTNIARIFPMLRTQLNRPIVIYRGYNAVRHEDYKLKLLKQQLGNPAYPDNSRDFMPGQEFLIPNFLATSVSHNSALRFSSPSSDNSIPSICWEIIIPPSLFPSIPYTYLSRDNVVIMENPLNEAEILINIGAKLVYVTSFIIENMKYYVPIMTASGLEPQEIIKDKVLFHRFMFLGYEKYENIKERLMNMKEVCMESVYTLGKEKKKVRSGRKTPYNRRSKKIKRKVKGKNTENENETENTFYYGLGKRKILSKGKRKNRNKRNKRKVNKS